MQDNPQPTPEPNSNPPAPVVPTNPYFSSQPVDVPPANPVPTPQGVAPQPIGTTPQTPRTPKPKNKKLRKLIVIGAGILVVAVGAFLIVPNFIEDPAVAALEAQFAKSTNYDYTKPQLNVDPTKTFNYNVNYDAGTDHVDSNGSPTGVVVYYDSALTKPASDVFYNTTTNSHTIVVTPSPSPESGLGSDTAIDLSKGNSWGLHDEYYIVQKLDANGNALKRPIVTEFTVKKALETPKVSYAVDDSGVAHFTWDKINGATKYYVVQFKTDPTDKTVTDTIIGQTTTNSWASAKDETEAAYDISQNDIFKNYTNSLDDLYTDPNYAVGSEYTGQGVQPVDYGVIASNDSKDYSAYSPVDGTSLQAQLPVETATNAVKQLGFDAEDLDTIDALPTKLPVTMADGSTVQKVVEIVTDQTKETPVIYTDHTNGLALKVTYVIKGSLISGHYYIADYDSNWKTELDGINTRNDAAQAKTGTGTANTFSYTGTKLGSNAVVSKTAPSVPYAVNATNPLTAYIAANMIDGQQYIDVSQYMKASNHPDLFNAANEAEYQNPYVVGVESIQFNSTTNIIIVQYNLTSDQIVAEQKALATEAKRVIGQIITPGMTDRQKGLAINNYIDNTASYNNAAFDALDKSFSGEIPTDYKDSWTAAGVLIDKSGVCVSYAEAFKLLADEAGLKSIVVTGIGGSGPHAWDKAYMDGKWQVVDPTWDDDGTTNNPYFGLTDAQLSKDHTQGTDFILQSLIPQYAAN